jgi:hypothetical protein
MWLPDDDKNLKNTRSKTQKIHEDNLLLSGAKSAGKPAAVFDDRGNLGRVERNGHDEKGGAKTNYDLGGMHVIFRGCYLQTASSTCHQRAFRFLSLSTSFFYCSSSMLKPRSSRNKLLAGVREIPEVDLSDVIVDNRRAWQLLSRILGNPAATDNPPVNGLVLSKEYDRAMIPLC